MSAAGSDLPAGPLTRFRRGLSIGIGSWAASFMIVALICITAWFANANSGVHITSAVKAAVIATNAGNLGGVRINNIAVTLAPGLVTLLLLAVLTHSMRLVEGKSGVAGAAFGYAVCAGLLASVHLGTTFAPRTSTFVAALVIAAVVGVVVHGWNPLVARLSYRWYDVMRAAAAASLGYVAIASLAAALSLGMHLNTATDLQRDLATGGAGLPVLLMGAAAAPNMVLACVGVLSGATVSFGGHSSVSLWSVQHGRLPAFPLFAAVPDRPFPTIVAVLVLVVTILLVGRFAARMLPTPARWTDTAGSVAAVGLLSGVAAGLATALADGSLGSRSLAHLGGTWWQTGLFVALGVCAGTAVWATFDLVRGARHQPDSDASEDSSHPSTAAGMYVLARK